MSKALPSVWRRPSRAARCGCEAVNGEHGTGVAARGVSFLREDSAPGATCRHRVLLTHAPRGQGPWEGDAPGTPAFGGVSAQSPPSPSGPSTPSDGPIPAPVGAELALLQPLLNRRVPPVQGQGLRPHGVQSMAGHRRAHWPVQCPSTPRSARAGRHGLRELLPRRTGGSGTPAGRL